jgi:hypothetical protein
MQDHRSGAKYARHLAILAKNHNATTVSLGIAMKKRALGHARPAWDNAYTLSPVLRTSQNRCIRSGMLASTKRKRSRRGTSWICRDRRSSRPTGLRFLTSDDVRYVWPSGSPRRRASCDRWRSSRLGIACLRCPDHRHQSRPATSPAFPL